MLHILVTRMGFNGTYQAISNGITQTAKGLRLLQQVIGIVRLRNNNQKGRIE